MKVAIVQPAFLPWCGYVNRLLCSDVVVFLDNVTPDLCSTHGYVRRNRIMGPNGEIMLTLPLEKEAKYKDIRDIDFAPNYQKALVKIEKSIEQSYARTKWLSSLCEWGSLVYPVCYSEAAVYLETNGQLLDCTVAGTLALMEYMAAYNSIDLPEVLFSSELSVAGKATSLLVNLCLAVKEKYAPNTLEYVSGSAGRGYIIEQEFKDAGIALLCDSYVGVSKYNQLHTCAKGKPFVANLSVVDVLCNIGPFDSYKHIYKPESVKPWNL